MRKKIVREKFVFIKNSDETFLIIQSDLMYEINLSKLGVKIQELKIEGHFIFDAKMFCMYYKTDLTKIKKMCILNNRNIKVD